MSGASSIEWTDATWNPVRGCSRVSEGCRNCYAERHAARFSDEGTEINDVGGHMHGALPFAGFAKNTPAGPRWTGEVALIPTALDWPLRKRKPLLIFVNSMSDLFHEKLSNEAIAAVFGVMAACPQHTFQILTKRPEQMREWFEKMEARPGMVPDAEVSGCILQLLRLWSLGTHPKSIRQAGRDVGPGHAPAWPLPNVWLGTSVENQATADERIPHLLATPAARRFVSAEPLLGPVDLSRWLAGEQAHDRRGTGLSGVRSNRSFLGGSGGSDLEAPAADCRKSGRDAAILEGTGDEARRAVDIGRLPDCHVLGRQEAAQGLRPSSGLDVLVEGRYSSGDAGQPQERDPNGHDSGEFGDGHKRRECSAWDPRPREEGEAPLRGGESGGEADRRSGAEHSSARREDVSIEDRRDARREAGHGVGGDSPEELGAHRLVRLDWIIVGGESGPGARPFDVAWARSTVEQCRAAGVACFVKQMGARPYSDAGDHLHEDGSVPVGCFVNFEDRKGGDWSEWPEDLRVREFPR